MLSILAPKPKIPSTTSPECRCFGVEPRQPLQLNQVVLKCSHNNSSIILSKIIFRMIIFSGSSHNHLHDNDFYSYLQNYPYKLQLRFVSWPNHWGYPCRDNEVEWYASIRLYQTLKIIINICKTILKTISNKTTRFSKTHHLTIVLKIKKTHNRMPMTREYSMLTFGHVQGDIEFGLSKNRSLHAKLRQNISVSYRSVHV